MTPLIIDGILLSGELSREEIARLLLKEYKTPIEIRSRSNDWGKRIRPQKPSVIMEMVFAQYSSIKESKNDEYSDDEYAVEDFIVYRMIHIDGRLYFEVGRKFPETPQRWFIPVAPGIDSKPRSIECLFDANELEREISGLYLHPLYMRGGLYFMKVLRTVTPAGKLNTIYLEEKSGNICHTKCSFIPRVGSYVKVKIAALFDSGPKDTSLAILRDDENYDEKDANNEFLLFSSSPKAMSIRKDAQGCGRHKAGTDFVCEYCGDYFEAKKGWRIEQREIFLCNYCCKVVFAKSSSQKKGWEGQFISTSM